MASTKQIKRKLLKIKKRPGNQVVVAINEHKKSFQIVALSLHPQEVEWIEKTVHALKKAGSPKANRSMVVQEAVLRLKDSLMNLDEDQILRDFIEHKKIRLL